MQKSLESLRYEALYASGKIKQMTQVGNLPAVSYYKKLLQEITLQYNAIIASKRGAV